MPAADELPDRLDSVLRAIYLVFNEGYTASAGASLTRHDLSGEAIRLGRLLVELLPEPEAMGLLALMLLHDSRRDARATSTGDVVLLDEQDRSLWHRDQIVEGRRPRRAITRHAPVSGPMRCRRRSRRCMPRRPSAAATDWAQIVGLYDVLLRLEPSPIVELNRAVAVAMHEGPAGRPRAGRLHCSSAANCPTTASRTRRAPTSTVGWVAGSRRGRPTSGRCS